MHCHRYPDENGDMVSGDGRTVTYAAFGKPTLIAKGAVSVAFKHRADRSVLKRIDTNASGTTTTTYIGARLYEKIVGPSGTKEKHYIGGFAVVTDTSTATETRYLHRDHLGSVDTITDETGAVAERMSFDAWGQRREADWAVMTDPFAYVSANTTRGFTNHEQLDPVGLVHMGGRVYEPVLGRFLSADPFVQDQTLTQALNRYSYVLNNPLSYTDPSGFFFSGLSKAFGGIGKAFAAFGSAMKKGLREIAKIPILNSIIAAAACAPHPAAPVSCPAYAFASTMAVGGSIGDAVFAAGVAYVGVSAFGETGFLNQTFGIASVEGQIASAAVFSFAVGSARSGNLKQGAIGAFSAAAGGALGSADLGFVGRTVAAAVVGGVTAELAGGNFVNGAVAGAFANLFAEAFRPDPAVGTSAETSQGIEDTETRPQFACVGNDCQANSSGTGITGDEMMVREMEIQYRAVMPPETRFHGYGVNDWTTIPIDELVTLGATTLLKRGAKWMLSLDLPDIVYQKGFEFGHLEQKFHVIEVHSTSLVTINETYNNQLWSMVRADTNQTMWRRITPRSAIRIKRERICVDSGCVDLN